MNQRQKTPCYKWQDSFPSPPGRGGPLAAALMLGDRRCLTTQFVQDTSQPLQEASKAETSRKMAARSNQGKTWLLGLQPSGGEAGNLPFGFWTLQVWEVATMGRWTSVRTGQKTSWEVSCVCCTCSHLYVLGGMTHAHRIISPFPISIKGSSVAYHHVNKCFTATLCPLLFF